MTTETLNPSREFAGAVRLALSDLPPEEVDELTDGLEADLAERAEDDSAPDFGDPMEYANELRLAAGLPPRSRPTRRELSAWAEFVQGLRELRAAPFVSSFANFFVALRPVWWLIRAWAFYGVLCWAVGASSLQVTPLTFALGVGTVIVSVQFGRGKWLPREWMRVTLRVINIVLVVMIPVIFVVTVNAFIDQTNAAYNRGTRDGEHEQNGLEYNGRSISNIFAYDANGQPLTQVQLYDQSGRPLYTVPDRSVPTSDYDSYLVPNALVHGRGGWNVYPLGFVPAKDLTADGNVKKGVKPEQSRLPDLAVPPLKNAPTPSPTPTATPAP